MNWLDVAAVASVMVVGVASIALTCWLIDHTYTWITDPFDPSPEARERVRAEMAKSKEVSR
jgi:hypothetical protein